MHARKKIWLTSSVLAVVALVAVLAIPVGASAKASRPATMPKIHCAASNDAVVDVSQFADDAFTADAVGKKCTGTVHFSYTSGKLAAPVKFVTKVTVDASGAFTGQFGNRLGSGTISGQVGTAGTPSGVTPGSYKMTLTCGIDFKPLTFYIKWVW
jgi:hypothetical protein